MVRESRRGNFYYMFVSMLFDCVPELGVLLDLFDFQAGLEKVWFAFWVYFCFSVDNIVVPGFHPLLGGEDIKFILCS